MLRSYENEMRAAAERIAEAERLTRRMVGDVTGREEKYTEVFRTHLEQQLDGFSEGDVSWRVVTYTTDKQSGQEKRVGADLVVAVGIDLDGFKQWKGFLVQAKVNKNIRHGVSVDSLPRLINQCRNMQRHTNEAYVFAYGNQSTKVLKAINVVTRAPLSEIAQKSIGEFFSDVMMCWAGDPNLVANDHRQLETLVEQMEGKSGVLLKAKTALD
jgi:hypothetical protein